MKIIHLDKSIFICEVKNSVIKSEKKSLDSAKHHIPVYNYCCHMCDLKFSSKIYLDSHSFTHIGTKPFICKNTCNVEFSSMKQLMSHIKSTHQISLLKQILSRELVKDLMSQHVFAPQIRTPLEICELCIQGFTSQTKLNNHKCNKNKKQKVKYLQSSLPVNNAMQVQQESNCQQVNK